MYDNILKEINKYKDVIDKYYIPNIHYSYSKEFQNTHPCDNCSNNPKNGGSGICACIIGLPKMR